MAVIAPARPRGSVQEGPEGLEIVIPPRPNWFRTLFLGAWLCGWAVGEFMVPTTFLSRDLEPEARMFAMAWLAAWTLGGGFAIYAFLWSIFGRERVLLTPLSLRIKRDLFGTGRVREYELIHIRDLRCAPAIYNPHDFRSGMQVWGIGGGTIAFDHGSATVRFGAGLEEGEAKAIIERMRSRALFASATS
jgi:hypothetical protein